MSTSISTLRTLAVTCAVGFSMACGPAAPGGEPSDQGTPPAVRDAQLDRYGREVFEAFVAGDTVALEAARLGQVEHNEQVYPALPVGRAGTFPVEMAWENIQRRHLRDRRRQLEFFEGRAATYRHTECLGETRQFESFEVRTDCWVVYDDLRLGSARVQLFKDVLVRGEGYLRAFRYYDGAPRPYGS